jgi:transcriptional regulator with XRE-family HTH domain
MRWWDYIQQHAHGDTQAEIAHRSGVTAPTVSRWSTGKQGVDPKAAASFARAYGRPVLEAFVAAEFLTAEEARTRPSPAPDLTHVPNHVLLDLVRSRMREVADEGTPGQP